MLSFSASHPGFLSMTVILLVLASFVTEFVMPLTLLAQPQAEVATSTSAQDVLPPMQEAEAIAKPPFYKRWWFWGLVALAVGGVAIAVAGGGGGGNGGNGSGSVSAKW
jgi:hypothetical protein